MTINNNKNLNLNLINTWMNEENPTSTTYKTYEKLKVLIEADFTAKQAQAILEVIVAQIGEIVNK